MVCLVKPSHHVSLVTVVARLLRSHTRTHRHKYGLVVTKVRTTERRRLSGCDVQSRRRHARATQLRSTRCLDIKEHVEHIVAALRNVSPWDIFRGH